MYDDEQYEEEGDIEVLREGWLMKSDPRGKRWKNRYCMLLDNFGTPQLGYYEGSEMRDDQLKGLFSLTGAVIGTGVDDKKIKPPTPYVFTITVPDRIYYFCAKTQEEMDEWVYDLGVIVGEIDPDEDFSETETVDQYTGDMEQYSAEGEPSVPQRSGTGPIAAPNAPNGTPAVAARDGSELVAQGAPPGVPVYTPDPDSTRPAVKSSAVQESAEGEADGGALQFRVISHMGERKKYTMQVRANKIDRLTVAKIKRNLSATSRIDVDSIELWYGDKLLQDEWTGSDFDLRDGSILDMKPKATHAQPTAQALASNESARVDVTTEGLTSQQSEPLGQDTSRPSAVTAAPPTAAVSGAALVSPVGAMAVAAAPAPVPVSANSTGVAAAAVPVPALAPVEESTSQRNIPMGVISDSHRPTSSLTAASANIAGVSSGGVGVSSGGVGVSSGWAVDLEEDEDETTEQLQLRLYLKRCFKMINNNNPKGNVNKEQFLQAVSSQAYTHPSVQRYLNKYDVINNLKSVPGPLLSWESIAHALTASEESTLPSPFPSPTLTTTTTGAAAPQAVPVPFGAQGPAVTVAEAAAVERSPPTPRAAAPPAPVAPAAAGASALQSVESSEEPSSNEMLMTVELPTGGSGDITVRVGDDPIALAQQFIQYHNLDPSEYMGPLCDEIRKTLLEAYEYELNEMKRKQQQTAQPQSSANASIIEALQQQASDLERELLLARRETSELRRALNERESELARLQSSAEANESAVAKAKKILQVHTYNKYVTGEVKGSEGLRGSESDVGDGISPKTLREWYNEKLMLLEESNRDKEELIRENKRLRSCLTPSHKDIELRFKKLDNDRARLLNEVSRLSAQRTRLESELRFSYKQLEEEGSKWAMERKRLTNKINELIAVVTAQGGADSSPKRFSTAHHTDEPRGRLVSELEELRRERDAMARNWSEEVQALAAVWRSDFTQWARQRQELTAQVQQLKQTLTQARQSLAQAAQPSNQIDNTLTSTALASAARAVEALSERLAAAEAQSSAAASRVKSLEYSIQHRQPLHSSGVSTTAVGAVSASVASFSATPLSYSYQNISNGLHTASARNGSSGERLAAVSPVLASSGLYGSGLSLADIHTKY